MSTLGSKPKSLDLCYFSPTEIIGLAYEAASNDRWPMFFTELDRTLLHVGTTFVVRGFGPTRYVSLAAPERGFTTTNPVQAFTNKGLSRKNFSMAYVSGELVEDWEQLHRVVREFRGPHGPVTAIQVYAGDGGTLCLEDRVLVRALLPHLHRAMAVYLKTQDLQHERDALSACLDQLSDGIVLLDSQATVLHMNASADLYLGDGVLYDEGKLRISKAEDDALFRHALKEATATPSGRLQVKRLHNGDVLWLRGLGCDRAIVFMGKDGRRKPIAPELLIEALGITPAEARVGSLFAGGQALPEIADELQISLHTVRQHLKKIQAKTGENRQASLLGKILGAVPPVRTSPI